MQARSTAVSILSSSLIGRFRGSQSCTCRPVGIIFLSESISRYIISLEILELARSSLTVFDLEPNVSSSRQLLYLYGESRRVVIGDDRGRKSDEKIDETRLDRSVADERLRLFRLVMCGHVSDNASLIDRNCHEDLSSERFGTPSRQKVPVELA